MFTDLKKVQDIENILIDIDYKTDNRYSPLIKHILYSLSELDEFLKQEAEYDTKLTTYRMMGFEFNDIINKRYVSFQEFKKAMDSLIEICKRLQKMRDNVIKMPIEYTVKNQFLSISKYPSRFSEIEKLYKKIVGE